MNITVHPIQSTSNRRGGGPQDNSGKKPAADSFFSVLAQYSGPSAVPTRQDGFAGHAAPLSAAARQDVETLQQRIEQVNEWLLSRFGTPCK